ncbi:MAG TPA: hypothetical protein VGK99_24315 [Acidobacteriota bacterium]|jgi:hypothetical protein
MRRADLLAMLVLLLLASLSVLRWAPQRMGTLADYAPQGPVFYFEIAPRSMFLGNAEKLANFGQDQQWLANALAKMPTGERPRVQKLLSDQSTRIALSISDLHAAPAGATKLEFLLLAQTSREHFSDLALVGDRWLRAALPPGHAVEMQSRPRLGALVGEPPKRLYYYEDFPLYAVSNSPGLISLLLEIRYRNLPSLAAQREFRNTRQALASAGGAVLYVNLRRLTPARSNVFLSPFMILQALNITDWATLAYGWDDVRGEIVRRTILIRR